MKKRMTITEQDYLKAHRKASREEELALYGRPLLHHKPHQSEKTYNRKNQKAALKKLPFENLANYSFVLFCKREPENFWKTLFFTIFFQFGGAGMAATHCFMRLQFPAPPN